MSEGQRGLSMKPRISLLLASSTSREKSQLSRDGNIYTNIKSKIFLDFSEQIMIVKREKEIGFQPFIYYYNKPGIKLTLWKKQLNFL
ncbi:MAG: hypothetical protein HG439_000335 [candidate division SR1 bacterium]|nr:hypothetical protein [candidate division SR1 bacterium]